MGGGNYIVIYAGPALSTLAQFERAEFTRATLYRTVAIASAAIAVLEISGKVSGVYQCYGPMPFRFMTDYPLWCAVLEASNSNDNSRPKGAPMPVDAVPIVEQMCQRWAKSYDDFCQAYRDHFAEGAEYVPQQGMPATHGADEALAVIEQFHAGFGVEAVEVDMIRIAQVGNDVWTERLDYMINAAGERFLTIPIMGLMTFNDDGLITRWIDYWDMRELLALAPAGPPSR